MSTEYYTPQQWEDEGHGEAGIEFGHSANGQFRWAPTWYDGDWDDPEVQAAFIEFLKAHPDIDIPTDQGTRSVSWLLPMLEDPKPSYTVSDARAQLRKYGWNV